METHKTAAAGNDNNMEKRKAPLYLSRPAVLRVAASFSHPHCWFCGPRAPWLCLWPVSWPVPAPGLGKDTRAGMGQNPQAEAHLGLCQPGTCGPRIQGGHPTVLNLARVGYSFRSMGGTPEVLRDMQPRCSENGLSLKKKNSWILPALSLIPTTTPPCLKTAVCLPDPHPPPPPAARLAGWLAGWLSTRLQL